MTAALAPVAPARPVRRGWVLSLARPYVRRRLARELDGLWVSGLDRLAPLLATGPVVFAPNHVSWWDPMVLVALSGALPTEDYVLMDAENLRRLPFMGWLGAVPLRRGRREEARADVLAAAGLLDGPGRSVWIFPQGRQRPAHLRPLELRPGVEWLVAAAGGVPVVPVSLQYGFREGERPAALVRFGRARSARAPVATLLPWLEAALVEGLGRCDAFLDQGLGDFRPLVAPVGRPSEAGGGARVLSWLGGGLHPTGGTGG